MTSLKTALEAAEAKSIRTQRYADLESEIGRAITACAANAVDDDGNAAMKHSQSVLNLSNALSVLKRDIFQ